MKDNPYSGLIGGARRGTLKEPNSPGNATLAGSHGVRIDTVVVVFYGPDNNADQISKAFADSGLFATRGEYAGVPSMTWTISGFTK